MSYELQEARELVIKAGLTLVQEGLIARTWGNISARISDTQFVITPSGRSYDSLVPEDIVIVNIKDCSYEGDIKPSGEKATHAVVYAAKPEVNFVIHTHQIYASAISILGDDVDELSSYNEIASTDSKDYEQLLGSSIACAKYSICCTDTLAKNVRQAIKKHTDSKAVFLKNHGVVAMGTSYDDTFLIVRSAEEVCKSKYDYIAGSFIESADCEVSVDYGKSVRDNGYIHLTVGDNTISWPIGYAAIAKKSDIPKSLRGIAMLHDTIYQNEDINCVEHVTRPFIVIISKLNSGKLKKGIRPYIDDQAQIAGTFLKKEAIKISHQKLRRIKHLEKSLADQNAILLTSGGALVYGANQDDIEALSMVIEKGCVAATLANLIPVIKPISKKTCSQMRDIYLNSYSKLKDFAITASTAYKPEKTNEP